MMIMISYCLKCFLHCAEFENLFAVFPRDSTTEKIKTKVKL